MAITETAQEAVQYAKDNPVVAGVVVVGILGAVILIQRSRATSGAATSASAGTTPVSLPSSPVFSGGGGGGGDLGTLVGDTAASFTAALQAQSDTLNKSVTDLGTQVGLLGADNAAQQAQLRAGLDAINRRVDSIGSSPVGPVIPPGSAPPSSSDPFPSVPVAAPVVAPFPSVPAFAPPSSSDPFPSVPVAPPSSSDPFPSVPVAAPVVAPFPSVPVAAPVVAPSPSVPVTAPVVAPSPNDAAWNRYYDAVFNAFTRAGQMVFFDGSSLPVDYNPSGDLGTNGGPNGQHETWIRRAVRQATDGYRAGRFPTFQDGLNFALANISSDYLRGLQGKQPDWDPTSLGWNPYIFRYTDYGEPWNPNINYTRPTRQLLSNGEIVTNPNAGGLFG